MANVVTIGSGDTAETHGNVGSVTYQQGELPPVPVVEDETFDILAALGKAVAGDDEALALALNPDREKRKRILEGLAFVPDETLRQEMRAVMERGLGDQIALEAVQAARPYYLKASKLLRDFRFGFERVEEHGRGVRLATRWTFRDPIQGKDFPAEQFAYPRGSLGRIGEVALFVKETLIQVAMRAFQEA